MGFSLKKLVRGAGRVVKKIGKAAKVVLPVAASLTGVGGLVGGAAATILKGAKKASALKSTGQNIKKAAFAKAIPISTAVQAMKQEPGPARATKRAAKPKKKKAAPKKKKAAAKKKAAPKKNKGTDALALYRAWVKAGRPGTWEEYRDRRAA